MKNPTWAQRAHINVDPRFDQYKIDIGYMDGPDFVPVDTLYAEREPEKTARRHYPEIECHRFGRASKEG